MILPAVTPSEPTADPDAERAYLLRATLAGATLLMVALSWPLWIDLADFPAIPLVRGFPDYPRAWSWIGLALIVAGLGLGMARRYGRAGVGLTIATMIWLILGDQLRFQPWVYQFLVLGTLLVVLPSRSALGFGCVWMASVYFHSGLSKLDVSFALEMGPLFVRTLGRVVGLGTHPAVATALRNRSTALLLPASEIVVALLLLIRPTRRIGYLGGLLIHGALLLILGPWGLGHSTIVLVWNVALAAEEYLLYWPRSRKRPGPPDHWTYREKICSLVLGPLMILPLGERVGLFDSWPSHALYADHCEGTTIYFRGGLPAELPEAARVAARPTEADGSWMLDPTDWTRQVRGVPAYPQARYGNGMVEWLAGRVGPKAGLLGVHRLRANPLTGEAKSLSARHLKEARELSAQFWFNAHPRDRSRR